MNRRCECCGGTLDGAHDALNKLDGAMRTIDALMAREPNNARYARARDRWIALVDVRIADLIQRLTEIVEGGR